MGITHVNSDNFEKEVLKADDIVLVDFYADWCGPCKMMGPVIEDFANERPDVKVCKCNIDDASDIATTYSVMSIPTLMIFKKGTPVKRVARAIPKHEILEMLD